MKWSELLHPTAAFGKREKGFNLGGKVEFDSLATLLTPNEVSILNLVLECLLNSATINGSDLNCLLVGSALLGQHVDLDMLCCTDPPAHRDRVVTTMFSEANKYFIGVEKRTTHNLLLAEHKLFMRKNFVCFDISFAGIESGTWDDIIQFHEKCRLSYCILR